MTSVKVVVQVVNQNYNTNMKTQNKTKKSIFKPAYIVDITKCEDVQDTLIAFGNAKQKAGYPITDEELDAIIDDKSAIIILHDICAYEVKDEKKSWYKRLWNWITRKK